MGEFSEMIQGMGEAYQVYHWKIKGAAVAAVAISKSGAIEGPTDEKVEMFYPGAKKKEGWGPFYVGFLPLPWNHKFEVNKEIKKIFPAKSWAAEKIRDIKRSKKTVNAGVCSAMLDKWLSTKEAD